MKTIIIDDDQNCHKLLSGMLAKKHDDLLVVGAAYDIEEGTDLLVKHDPDLIFLDIELPDGLGFDLLSKIRALQLDCHIIFITAHDKYAITAIRFGALDFLLKPIEEEELLVALQKARTLQKRRFSYEQLQILVEAYEKAQNHQLPSRLAIPSQSDVSYIKVENIVRLEAQQVYTNFHIQGHEKPVLSSSNLGKYVEQFKLYREFVQVHRSHMINLHYVTKYVKSDQTIILKDGSSVGLSRSFMEGFREGMRAL